MHISELPEEILREILLTGWRPFNTDEWDYREGRHARRYVYKVSRLCSRIRSIAITIPTLWSTLDPRYLRTEPELQTWIERSGETGLSVWYPRQWRNVVAEYDGYGPAFTLNILACAARLKRLCFVQQQRSGIADHPVALFIGFLTRLQSCDLPLLQSVEVSQPFMDPATTPLLWNIYSRAANVSFIGVTGLPLHISHLPACSAPNLVALQLDYLCPDTSQQYTAILDLLQHFPTLKSLRLGFRYDIFMTIWHEDQTPPQFEATLFPSLQELEFSFRRRDVDLSTTTVSPWNVLASIRAPNLYSLSVDCPRLTLSCDNGFRTLEECLRGYTRLKSLWVVMDPSDYGGRYLITSTLFKLPTLQSVLCGFRDDSANPFYT